MNFNNEIVNYIDQTPDGMYIVNAEKGTIVLATNFLKKQIGYDVTNKAASEVFAWEEYITDNTDTENNTIYEQEWISAEMTCRIRYAYFILNDTRFRINQIENITEYIDTSAEITKYLAYSTKISDFQKNALEHIDNPQTLLSLFHHAMSNGNKYLFIAGKAVTADFVYTFEKKTCTCSASFSSPEQYSPLFEVEVGSSIPASTFINIISSINNIPQQLISALKKESAVQCLIKGTVSGTTYLVLSDVYETIDDGKYFAENTINVLKLCLENGIMKESILYASEHDQLTGLYNKGKFMDMSERVYRHASNVGIINFDVNNLKKINDTLGHEAGDKLIKKAADSIKAVQNSNVYGYRMGGDEFLVAIADCTPEDLTSVLHIWEKALDFSNQEDSSILCVIAAGSAHITETKDFSELMKLADERMYEDKKKKKENAAQSCT